MVNYLVLYRAGSFTAAATELVRYKLDVVDVQEVRWDKGSTVRAGDYDFFSTGKEMKISQLGTVFFFCTPQNSISSEERSVC